MRPWKGNCDDAFVGMGIVAIMADMSHDFSYETYALISPASPFNILARKKSPVSRLNEIAITRNHIGDVLLSLVVIFGLSAVLSLVFIVPILVGCCLRCQRLPQLRYESFIRSNRCQNRGNARDSGITGV